MAANATPTPASREFFMPLSCRADARASGAGASVVGSDCPTQLETGLESLAPHEGSPPLYGATIVSHALLKDDVSGAPWSRYQSWKHIGWPGVSGMPSAPGFAASQAVKSNE